MDIEKKKEIVDLLNQLVEEYGENFFNNKFFETSSIYDSLNMKELETLLLKLDKFSIFNNCYQAFFSGAELIDLKSLIIWMIQRAYQTSSEGAVEDVNRYIDNNEFEAYQVMLLSEMHITQLIDFENGIILSPINKLPNTDVLNSINQLNCGLLGIPNITCVLIKKIKCCKRHFYNIEDFKSTRLSFNEFEDIRLSFSTSQLAGKGLQAIGTSVLISNGIPIINGISWNSSSFRQPPKGPELIKINSDQVVKFYKDFSRKPNDLKNRIRIGLKMLNYYDSTFDYVEKAMYIRTALESIYFTKQVSGIKSTLMKYISEELGVTLEEKKVIKSNVKIIYELASKIIHTGKLEEKNCELVYEKFPIGYKYILQKIYNLNRE